MNRLERAADRDYIDHLAERNMRAARIAKMRKEPRRRGQNLADIGLTVLFCLAAMAPFVFSFVMYLVLR